MARVQKPARSAPIAPGFPCPTPPKTGSAGLRPPPKNPGIAPAEFAELYFRRGGIELHFWELKTFLKMDILRCPTPAMIEREVRMHFVAYNLIRCVMQTAALTHHTELRRVSFKRARDTVRQFANATQGAGNRPKNHQRLTRPRRQMGNLPHRKTAISKRPKVS